MLVVRILKVSSIATGVLVIALIILKAISIVKEQKKIPTIQDLIDKGVHPTVKKFPKINGNKKNNMKD
jgi:hypothetical protein